MTAVPVVNDNEVLLGDTYFPTKGPVRVTNITVTQNPVTFGDTSKQTDTQVMTQLIQASNTGGSGVYKANPRTDVERSWTSQLETRFRNYVTLPPFAFEMGKPAAITGEDLVLSFEFRNEQYFIFANKVYKWTNATNSWSNLLRTLGATPTDAIVFKGALYIACGTTIEKLASDGSTWSIIASPATFFTLWDTLIWKLYDNSGAYTLASSADAAVWADKTTHNAEPTPTALTVYRDANGATVIYLLTEEGPWLYDATNTRFLRSEVQFPRVTIDDIVKATGFRDGKLYMTSGGLGIIAVQSGNPFVIAPVGLDVDDGVPSDETGRISAISADFNWLLALTDSSKAGDPFADVTGGNPAWEKTESLSGLMSPFATEGWSEQLGSATLRAWQGGWHRLWTSSEIGRSGKVISVSSAYDFRRIYWGAGGKAYYIDIDTQVHNPRNNPSGKFQAGPLSHITPWFHYGSEVQKKIHGHFLIQTKDCSSTEVVQVYYGVDLDDDNWYLLGTITTDGLHEFKVGGREGKVGQFFRFKIILSRGSTTTARPIVEFWASEIMRLLPATYAFQIELDLTKTHRGQTPAQLLADLKRLSDLSQTANFIQFSYADDYEVEPQTYYGRISRLVGSEFGGSDNRGQGNYLVSFVAPYYQDAE